jgi:hypothetical protein
MLLAAVENADEAGGPGPASRKARSATPEAGVANQARGPYRRLNYHDGVALDTCGCHMRVLLASDGSSDARRATRWLRDMALPADTRVSVLTVAT